MDKNVILLTDKILGTTNEKELGQKLLTGFLYTYCNLETEELPSHIILYTDAVKLAVKGDYKQIQDHFNELSQKGVDILLCGACLEFFEIGKNISFGRVSNMLEIVQVMNACKKVIKP